MRLPSHCQVWHLSQRKQTIVLVELMKVAVIIVVIVKIKKMNCCFWWMWEEMNRQSCHRLERNEVVAHMPGRGCETPRASLSNWRSSRNRVCHKDASNQLRLQWTYLSKDQRREKTSQGEPKDNTWIWSELVGNTTYNFIYCNNLTFCSHQGFDCTQSQCRRRV